MKDQRLERSRIAELDGLRGVAILLVMIFHMAILESQSAVDSAFLAVAGSGWVGVELFFALSGFLITAILLDTRTQPSYFRSFWMRRVLRIFPLYYAVLTIALVVLPLFPHPKIENFSRIHGDEIWYWLYLSNYSIAAAGAFRHGILDISWSLAIEEQFYLIWPFVVLLVDRRTLAKICVGAAAASLIMRCWLLAEGINPVALYVLTPVRLEALAMGALAAVLVRSDFSRVRLAQLARTSLILSSALLCVLAAVSGGVRWDDPLVQTIGYTLIAIAFGALVLRVVTTGGGDSTNAWLRSGVLRTFGKYSYAMYLFHLPIRAAVRDLFYGSDQFLTLFGSRLPGQLIFMIISVGITLILAWLSWHAYERYFLRLKYYFPYRRREPIPAALDTS